jgi:hypothetical protein
MLLPAGVLAGKVFISSLIFCCAASEWIKNKTKKERIVLRNIVQSKEKYAKPFNGRYSSQISFYF